MGEVGKKEVGIVKWGTWDCRLRNRSDFLGTIVTDCHITVISKWLSTYGTSSRWKWKNVLGSDDFVFFEIDTAETELAVS
jgi:hypothetical protein